MTAESDVPVRHRVTLVHDEAVGEWILGVSLDNEHAALTVAKLEVVASNLDLRDLLTIRVEASDWPDALKGAALGFLALLE